MDVPQPHFDLLPGILRVPNSRATETQSQEPQACGVSELEGTFGIILCRYAIFWMEAEAWSEEGTPASQPWLGHMLPEPPGRAGGDLGTM